MLSQIILNKNARQNQKAILDRRIAICWSIFVTRPERLRIDLQMGVSCNNPLASFSIFPVLKRLKL
jgi:hypothetical protein